MKLEEAEELHKKKFFFKVVNDTGWSAFGHQKYILPTDGKPSKWQPKRYPELCFSGYHVSDGQNLDSWYDRPHQEVWLVEVKGAHQVGRNKQAWEQMRFIRKMDIDFKSSKRVLLQRQVRTLATSSKLRPLCEQLLKELDRKKPRKAVVATLTDAIADIRYNPGFSRRVQNSMLRYARGDYDILYQQRNILDLIS